MRFTFLPTQTPGMGKLFRVADDLVTEAFATAVDAGLHGADIGAHERRDLLVVEAKEIGKHDSLALIEWDAEKGGLEFAGEFQPLGQDRGAGAGIGEFEWRAVIIGFRIERIGLAAALAPAKLIFAFIGSDAKQPAAETALREAGHGTIGGEECFLCRILRRFGITQKAKTEVVDNTLIALNKTVECLKVAVL
jgi:hypothetical protein